MSCDLVWSSDLCQLCFVPSSEPASLIDSSSPSSLASTTSLCSCESSPSVAPSSPPHPLFVCACTAEVSHPSPARPPVRRRRLGRPPVAWCGYQGWPPSAKPADGHRFAHRVLPAGIALSLLFSSSLHRLFLCPNNNRIGKRCMRSLCLTGDLQFRTTNCVGVFPVSRLKQITSA